MRDCSCIYVEVDGGDRAEFYKSKIIKARKDHICYECGEPILKGDSYERVTAKWDRDIDTIKTCRNCLSIREEFFCDGYLHGTMWDDYEEHIRYSDGEISSECIMNLTDRAKEKTFEIIQSIWDDD